MPRVTVARIRELFILDRTNWVLVWKIRRGPVAIGSIAGGIRSDGYHTIGVDGRRYGAHVLIYAYVKGEFPTTELDHRNHIRSDNRISNLRTTSHSGNHKNQSFRRTNTSGITGVSWHKRASKWVAQIKVDGCPIYLGLFSDKGEAAKAREKAEKKYGFHPNHGKK